MEANKILRADILDIIFEGKNKLYGAYQLRKTYNNRLAKALMGTASILLMILIGTVLAGGRPSSKTLLDVGPDIELKDVVDELPKPPVEPVLPPPEKIPNQVKYVPPVIVNDDKVKPDEIIAEITDDQMISSETIKTDVKIPIVQAPVTDLNSKLVEMPGKKEEPDIFTKVEIDAAFPGGLPAWKKYLEKNLDAETALNNGAGEGVYTVLVRFVVDIDGSISDVVSETKTGYGLEAEAIKIIKKGPKWQPAIQNGEKVKAYRRQSISFVVGEQ